MPGPRLVVSGLGVRYGARIALDGVDLVVGPGTTTAVIGPNGSGKSTLLAAIAGLVGPASGTIEVDRRRTALVLQSTEVDPSLPITVAETVRMGRYPHQGLFGRFTGADRDAITSAMTRVGVEDLADRQLHALSGGQRQRVLVAQGLAQQADLVLLDEPVTGLDVASRDMILDAVAAERDAARAVVMTTHNLEDARRADQVLLLATWPVAVGAPGDVMQGEHLRVAFGGRVLSLDGNSDVVMDDPHHHRD